MINIDFFKYKGEKITVNKELNEPFTLIGSFYSTVDLINPIVVLRGFDLTGYNYCYIEQLNRYYFINDVVLENNTDLRVYLNIDVIKTYENVILDSVATVSESSSAGKYISSRNNTFDKRPKFEVLEFENDLFKESEEIIMITIKGANE